MKYRVIISLIFLALPGRTKAQIQKQYISKIIFNYSSNGGWPGGHHIQMNIRSNGEMTMYNNQYDTVSVPTALKSYTSFKEGGKTIYMVPAQDSLKVMNSLSENFAGNIGSTDFNKITDLIIANQNLALKGEFHSGLCGYDAPYAELHVVVRQDTFTFMYCLTKQDRAKPLLDHMLKVASKKGISVRVRLNAGDIYNSLLFCRYCKYTRRRTI